MNQDPVVQAFQFTVDSQGSALVISLTGSLSDESNRKAKEEFLQLLKEKPKRLIVDLSKIDYISSSGIALLVSILCRCRQLGCSMCICGLRPDTRELFHLTRLSQVFEIHEDLKSALQA